MTNAIEAVGLTKRFGDTQALDGVDLAAREGTVLGVLGPNGAGKTTAVRVLATLLRPDSGTARVAGFDVLRQPAEVRARIGLTGQYASVDEDLTGTQNLLLIGQLLGLRTADALADEITVIDRGQVIAHDTPDALKHQIGGQRLRVRPVDPRHTGEVRDLLAGLTHTVPETTDRGEITCRVDDDSLLPELTSRLHTAGVTVSELSLHLPSLDEVFLTLTGRPTDETTEEAA
jgi:ABC-type multidrug transport system ATPase subunit